MKNTEEISAPSGTSSTSGMSSIYKLGQPDIKVPGTTQTGRAFRTVQSLSASTSQSIEALTSSPRQKYTRASTELYKPSDALYSKIEATFWKAKGEFFEDGMESTFSRQLDFFVKRYGDDALEAMTRLIVNEKVDPEAAGEALRWLGRIDHTESYEDRLRLLQRSLSLFSARVRDGATLGLASMNNKHAIPHLKSAIEKEQCSELKADMESVLKQLES